MGTALHLIHLRTRRLGCVPVAIQEQLNTRSADSSLRHECLRQGNIFQGLLVPRPVDGQRKGGPFYERPYFQQRLPIGGRRRRGEVEPHPRESVVFVRDDGIERLESPLRPVTETQSDPVRIAVLPERFGGSS